MSLDFSSRETARAGFLASKLDPACDKALMAQVAALRYHVYCQEQGFLNACDYPDELESDAYDTNSFHFASQDHVGELAGYVRLVRPDARGALPFQRHGLTLYPEAHLPHTLSSAEVSRLIVHAAHRRQGDCSPEVLRSLFCAMYRSSLEQGVRYWYAAMERSLARVIQRLVSIELKQIGPVSDYYGPVAPYLIDLHDLRPKPNHHRAHVLKAMKEEALMA